MKILLKTLLVPLLLILFVVQGNTQDHMSKHQQGKQEHKMINPESLQWQDGPASLPKGAKMAVLSGDLTKEGPFTVRLKVPANYKVPPHWHPAIEHVTVLKGELYMGAGEKFDMTKATSIKEGGFAVMPIKYVHYAFTKTDAIIQLHGMGPWGITYVNSKDDPRNTMK